MAGRRDAPRLDGAVGRRRSRRPLRARPRPTGGGRSRSSTTAIPAASGAPRTSATTSRASPRWATSSATQGVRLHGPRRPRRACSGCSPTGCAPSASAATSTSTSRSGRSTATPPSTRRSPRTPGSSASAGTCTRSSACATASRCTATCGRSSSRSIATSGTCSTPEAIEYLMRYGPVGCRDWTTVYLLLSIGVPAFFSGCLTTTIDTVFPDLRGAAARPTRPSPTSTCPRRTCPRTACLQALERRGPGPPLHRQRPRRPRAPRHLPEPASRGRDLAAALLPAAALDRREGRVPAEEPRRHPLRRAWTGSTTARSRRCATACSTSSSRSSRAILSGRSEARCTRCGARSRPADVAAAERRAAPRGPASRRRRDGGADLRRAGGGDGHARAGRRRRGPLRRCCAAADEDTLARAGRVACWSTRRARCTCGCRRLAARRRRPSGSPTASRRSPSSWVPTDGLDPDLMPLRLADLLPGRRPRDRAAGCPRSRPATSPSSRALDLGGHALAAPTRPGRVDVSGFGLIHAAAARLARPDRRGRGAPPHGPRPPPLRLRRVLDRRAGAGPRAPAAATRCSSRRCRWWPSTASAARRSCTTWSGPSRAVVPERWATVPTRIPERGPGLLHWADAVKPWQPELTPERERWRHYA